MYTFVTILLVISCIALITLVLLQQSKSAGLSGSISGGAEQLFGKQKARGLEAILHRLTIVFSVLFIVLSLLVVYLGN